MKQVIWLVLSYQVPIEPSKNRVYIWRKLKELGAGYFKQGVAILPKSPASTAKFKALQKKILDMGGEATLAELKFCDKSDELSLIAWFQSQSDSEYMELLRDCGKIVKILKDNLLESKVKTEHTKKIINKFKSTKSRDYFKTQNKNDIPSEVERLFADVASLSDDITRQIYRILND